MKKAFLIFLSVCLLLSFPGCNLQQEPAGESVQFFYLRNPESYLYGASDGVVTFEQRDAAGHTDDLRYLLALYLQGPVSEDLCSPFPAGCKVQELSVDTESVSVTLSSGFAALKGMDLTLACVCLGRTCISVADVSVVHISAKSSDGKTAISQTITIDSLLLEDYTVPTEAG